MAKTIQEVFKQFCKERHAEDKGRNHDLLQEVYASTEFFDTTLYKLTGIEMTPIRESLKGNGDLISTFPIENFSMPFPNLFMEVGDHKYLFLREYSPEIITGTVYITDFFKEKDIFYRVLGANLNLPFTLQLHEGKGILIGNYNTHILKPFIDLEKLLKETFLLVAEECLILNELSKKAIAVDKPSNVNLYEYYRRKRKPTLKVPQRPIYYVLGEKHENVLSKYERIRPMGKLETSYAFRVRGHWRHIGDKTLGKDRNGNYNIKGFTWVTEYTKGEGELAKRIRVIK